MMEHQGSALQADLTAELGRYQPQRGRYYNSVTALMLLWEDDDLGCLIEVEQLSALLEAEFHYRVERFLIPSTRPQASLARAVSEFLYSYGSFGNLVLFYYAGHGDPDLDGERQAVWAALRMGGPTVRWHLIQPGLEEAECDVLIFLDCCFAGQAARGRAFHNVELLAAAAMGLRTPGVGQKHPSFTKILMAEMKRLLYEEQSFEVATLYKSLLRKEHNLQQQPFHVTLHGESIVFRKLSRGQISHIQSEISQSMAFRLEVSLFEQPSEIQKEKILQWLTTSSPSAVSTIDIETVYTKARSVAHVGQKMCEEDSKDGSKGSSFIPIAAKENLVKHFERMISTVDRPIPVFGPNEAYIIEIIESLRQKSGDLLETIEDCITNTTSGLLRNLAKIEETKIAGLSDRVSMRLEILKELAPVEESYEETKVRFERPSKDRERLRDGVLGAARVILEYYYQDSDSGQSIDDQNGLPATAILQAKKVAALHAEPKDNSFCTLEGRGIVREHLHQPRLGFIYAVPSRYAASSYLLLGSCFREFPAVPLEIRVSLALKLATAVISLHSIGWLHKNIKSANVLVFCRSKPGSVKTPSIEIPAALPDLKSPFFLGFDCSRPAAAESLMQTSWDRRNNVYRHPDRWGRPLKFVKKHDLYALGVLLLEIAFWRPIQALDPEKKAFSKIHDPENLRNIFIDLCQEKLPHTVGSKYATAVKSCLTGAMGDEGDDWHFQRYVRDRIVGNLRFD